MFVRPQNEKRQIKPTTPCKGVVSAPEGEHGKMLFLKQSKEPQTAFCIFFNLTFPLFRKSPLHLAKYPCKLHFPVLQCNYRTN